MKKNLKKITMGIMTLTMALTLFCGTAIAAPALSDGNYTIAVEAQKDDGSVATNANGAITKPAKLEVSDGTVYALVEIKNSMSSVTANGSAATQVSSVDGKTLWKFPVTDLGTSIPMTVVVAAMGNSTQSFNLVFDSNSLVNVTPQTPPTDTQDTKPDTTNPETTNKVSNPKTSDSGFEALGTVVLLACLLSAGVLALNNRVKTREN